MAETERKNRSYKIRSGGLTPMNLNRSLNGVRERAKGEVLLLVTVPKDRHLPRRLEYLYWGKKEKGLEIYFTDITPTHLYGIATTTKMQECPVAIRIGALRFCQVSYQPRSR